MTNSIFHFPIIMGLIFSSPVRAGQTDSGAKPVGVPLAATVRFIKTFKSPMDALQILDSMSEKTKVKPWLAFFKAHKNDLEKMDFASVTVSGNALHVPGVASDFIFLNDGKSIEYNGVRFTYTPDQTPEYNVKKMQKLWGNLDSKTSFIQLLVPEAKADVADTVLNVSRVIGVVGFVTAAVTGALFLKSGKEGLNVATFSLLYVSVLAIVAGAAAKIYTSGIVGEFKCKGIRFFNKATKADITGSVSAQVNREPWEMFVEAMKQGCKKNAEKTEEFMNSFIASISQKQAAGKLDMETSVPQNPTASGVTD